MKKQFCNVAGTSVVVLDAGHGGRDSGSIFRKLFEKNITLDICQRVKRMLVGHKIVPVLTRVSDYDLPLAERCRIANELKADYFISIHCNADPDPDSEEFAKKQAKGEEIWYFEGSKEDLNLAKHFSASVDDFFPHEPFRGIKPTKNFYVLRRTVMPSILLECGFIDNSTTAEAFSQDKTIERIARLISDVLRIF